MEILVSPARWLLPALWILLFWGGCKKRTEADHPQAQIEDCERLCEKIKVCNQEIYAPKGVAKTRIAKRALAFYKNKKGCMSSCHRRMAQELKTPEVFGKERYFIAHQVACVKGTSCQEFATCQQESFTKAVAQYPLDPVTAERCDKVCERRHTCASQILPRSLGKKFTALPEDKKAMALKKWSDRVHCLHKCRYNHIMGKQRRPVLGSHSAASNELFFLEFSVYLNCISHVDCGAFAQCTSRQMNR